MAGVNGRVPLSALDLLGLADQRKVARLDLAEAGYTGVVYVCDLTAAQQQKIVATSRQGKRIRQNMKENWAEFDFSDLLENAGAKFMEVCLVTDREGGATLERAFAAAVDDEGGEAEWITFPASELVLMFDLMSEELKKPHLAREKLEQFPNAVTSLVIRTMKRISGMAEDQVEEKKESS